GALIKRIFEDNKRVHVTHNEHPRQYHACGDTLVCMHHGDLRTKELDQIARVEGTTVTGIQAKRVVIMQGHFHKFNLEQKGNTIYTTCTSGGPQDQWEIDNFGVALDRQITAYYVANNGPITNIMFESV